jgi:hypothetical protein
MADFTNLPGGATARRREVELRRLADLARLEAKVDHAVKQVGERSLTAPLPPTPPEDPRVTALTRRLAIDLADPRLHRPAGSTIRAIMGEDGPEAETITLLGRTFSIRETVTLRFWKEVGSSLSFDHERARSVCSYLPPVETPGEWRRPMGEAAVAGRY